MKESCNNCLYMKTLIQFDYSGKGCKHTKQDGYACTAFASEGEVIWLIGDDPSTGMCECYMRNSVISKKTEGVANGTNNKV